MMDADCGKAKAESEAVREGGADEKRAREAGALRERNRVEVRLASAGAAQHIPDQRQEPPDVIARRELRYHAPVRVVERDLRVERVGEQPAGTVVDRRPGLVAGGLDAQNQHGFSSFS